MATGLQELKRSVDTTIDRFHERMKVVEDRQAAVEKQVAAIVRTSARESADILSDKEIFRMLLDKLAEVARGG